jgi:hypothetical protein
MQPAEQHNIDAALRYFDGCNTGELDDLRAAVRSLRRQRLLSRRANFLVGTRKSRSGIPTNPPTSPSKSREKTQ